jgi:hypothetical protein
MSTFFAAARAQLTEQSKSALPALPAEKSGEADFSQQNQGCLTRLTRLTEKTIRYDFSHENKTEQRPDRERGEVGARELYIEEGKTGKAVRQTQEKPTKTGILAALRENFEGQAGQADLEAERDLRLETGLLEKEFLSSQANRYNLLAGKACVSCLFHDAGKCAWHDRAIDKWSMLCEGVYWEAKPHPAKKTYAVEWLAYFRRMKAAFPEKFEGVDLTPFEEMAAKEEHIFARCAAKYARQGLYRDAAQGLSRLL